MLPQEVLNSRYIRSLLILCFAAISLAAAAQKQTISGYVTDEGSGETLIGANVYIKELLKGTSSNQYGFYSITLEPGEKIV